MPIKISESVPQPIMPTADIIPDYRTDKPLDHVPLISMEEPIVLPANFAELSVEEQEKFKARYRFMGIRCRADIKDRTIPLTQQTMDIP